MAQGCSDLYQEGGSPELFRRKTNTTLTAVEENNEANRFLGWAIFSAKKRFAEEKCKHALSSMMMREREIDDEYMEKYYDSNMGMLNHGGLTIVNKQFFSFGKLLLSTIRNTFDVDVISQDPSNAFENAKMSVVANTNLKFHFTFLCEKYSLGNTDTCNKVYDVFLTKTIHARFAVVFRHWKEANVKTHHHCQAYHQKEEVKIESGEEG